MEKKAEGVCDAVFGGCGDRPERVGAVLRASRSCFFHVRLGEDGKYRAQFGAEVEAITGLNAEAFRRDSDLWWKIVFEEDRAIAMRPFTVQGEAQEIAEYRVVGRDGRIRWVRSVSVANGTGEGGFDGLLTDVTDWKEEGIARESLLENCRKMVSRDPMTGLLNRTGMHEELERIWTLSRRHPFSIGLLMVDIDHFKAVNDTHGHLAGDAAIREIAESIQSGLRDTDSVCRYAGDEMVAILPWTDAEQTRRIGERIRKDVAARVFCEGRYDLRLTVSIGAHVRTPLPHEPIDTFVQAADQALYRAKQEGRDRLCFAAGMDADPAPDESEALPAAEPVDSAHGRVLVVDDEEGIRRLVRRMLEKEGYGVVEASTPSEATAIVERKTGLIDVALVDLCLGEHNGLDLIARLREQDPLLLPMVITGNATMDRAVGSLRAGAYDFLKKPFTAQELVLLVRRAMDQRRLLAENRRYQQHLEAMVRHRGRSLSKALEAQRQMHRCTLEAMAALIDAREKGMGRHSMRVARMAVVLAEEMGMPPEDVEQIRNGALLHDIGKIALPDSILLKAGPLTDEEWGAMKDHPRIGYDVISGNSALAGAARIVLSHHEKYDGTGYPEGLKGDEIDLGARIFSVVDSYDAMRALRIYSPAQSRDEALEEIVRNKGGQFDPAVVEAFVRCQSRIEAAVSWNQGDSDAQG